MSPTPMMTPAERIAARLNYLACCHTAFAGFQALLDAAGGYSPSLRTRSHHDEAVRAALTELADAYDAAQEKRGDPRRAFRS